MKLRKIFTGTAATAAMSLFGSMASAQNCAIEVDSTDAMQFDKEVIVVDKSCKEFTVTLTHSGQLGESVMGHNWVLTESDDVQPVATEGMNAGLENEYVKPGDDRVIAHTEIIGGGEKTSVTFPVDQLSADKVYTFFCSFPGHWSVMRGNLSVK